MRLTHKTAVCGKVWPLLALTGFCLHGDGRSHVIWGAEPVAAVTGSVRDRVGDDWPQFRGPDGQGHAASRGLPLKWSKRKHIAWKVRIPGQGWSSPVVRQNQIWLTTAVDSNRSLRAVCVDRRTGRLLHDVGVFRINVPGGIHPKNSHASPTPVLVDDHVFVHFGAHGTACLSRNGRIVWKTRLPYYHHHGPAGSPVVVDGLLVVACDGFTEPFYDQVVRSGISEHQFVVALDRRSGQIGWKRPRIDGRHSYATPLTIVVNGKTQIVSPGGDRVVAYDPETGDEIWWCRYTGYSIVPRPVFGCGMVFVCTGYDIPTLVAIRPDGQGDVTDTHVEWSLRKGAPLSPSPLLIDDELYIVNDKGIACCLDAKTGEKHWRRRLNGNFSASPVFADGRIYFQNEIGTTYVVAPGTRFRKLATNRLGKQTLASMAIAGNSIFIRTDRDLYRIEDRDAS